LFYLPGTAPGTVTIECRKRASGGIGLLTADEKLGSTSPVGMDVAHTEIELGITPHIVVCMEMGMGKNHLWPEISC
jgi:hypothetical protein